MDCDFRQCNEMLKSIPVLNEIIKNNTSNFESNLHEWFKKITFEEYKRIKTFFAELGVDFFVEYIPVGGSGSGNTTEDEFKQFQQYVEEGKITKLRNDQVLTLVEKSISKEVMNAYKYCIEKKTEACIAEPVNPVDPVDPVDPIEPDYGIKFQKTKNGSYINIAIWYVPYNESDPWPIVEDFFVSESAKCLTGCLKNGEKLKSEHVVVLEKIDPKEATVTIKFNKGTIVISLETDRVPPVKIQRFRVNYNIQEPDGSLLKCTLPPGYKILSAFRNSPESGIVLGDFPISPNEWNVRLNGPQRGFNTYIIAIHDPTNQWEVKIFKNKVINMNKAQCAISEGYILTGGGVDLFFRPSEENIRYLVGLNGFYPIDNNTWSVSINGQLDALQWDLSAYAIGLKKKGDLESNISVSNDNTVWSFEINDQTITPVSGGFALNVPNDAVGDIMGIMPLDLIPGSENLKGFGFGWQPTTGLVADSKFTKYVISLKHPEMDIIVQPGINDINI